MRQWIAKAGPAMAMFCIAILAGCESTEQKQKAAMPLKGACVVVADEFDGPAPWKPDVLGSMDHALASMIKARYNWGLAAAQDLTNALAKERKQEEYNQMIRESQYRASGS